MSDTIHISIVEDNRYIRSGWEAILRAVPEFELSGSYGSCEEAFRDAKFAVSDVVLMDIGLPGMSGIDGVRSLKLQSPETVVVMCTVHDDDQNVFNAICAGAAGYLLKKTPPAELIQAIKDASSGGSPMIPNIARKVLTTFQKPTLLKTAKKEDQLTEREREACPHNDFNGAGLLYFASFQALADRAELACFGLRPALTAERELYFYGNIDPGETVRVELLAARDRPSDYHGSTYYESLDDPDLLVDIADWESPEARTTHLAEASAAGAYGPVFELVAGPVRATVIRPLP